MRIGAAKAEERDPRIHRFIAPGVALCDRIDALVRLAGSDAMEARMYCHTCCHWEFQTRDPNNKEQGICKKVFGVMVLCEGVTIDAPAFVAIGHKSSDFPVLITSADFGCVLHETSP